MRLSCMRKILKKIFRDILKLIRKGELDPKKPIANQLKKYLNKTDRRQVTEDCWKQWYIYIPPIGIPDIICKGNCP